MKTQKYSAKPCGGEVYHDGPNVAWRIFDQADTGGFWCKCGIHKWASGYSGNPKFPYGEICTRCGIARMYFLDQNPSPKQP